MVVPVVFIFIILGIVVVVLCLRSWKTTALNRDLSLQLGYGYYGQPVESGCHYTPGQNYGLKTITVPCIPHDKTKFGCLNENGELSYNSKILTEPCRIIPRYKFFVDEETPCLAEAKVCLTEGSTGIRRRKQICVSESGQGLNECRYVCGTQRDDYPACQGQAGKVIQFGTFLFGLPLLEKITHSTGYTIFPKQVDGWPVSPPYRGKSIISDQELYDLDSVLTFEENCSDHGKPICGEWMVQHPVTKNLEPCTPGDNYGIGLCSHHQTTNPFLIFETGWTTFPAICTKEACLPPVDSVSSLNDAVSGRYLFTDQMQGCLKSCNIEVDYLHLNVDGWRSELGILVRSFSIFQVNETFLTLQHVPRQVGGSIPVSPLKDTFSDPSLPLEDTLCMMLSNRNWRQHSSEKVQLDSSIYILVKPYVSDYSKLLCNLRAVFGSYNGWLAVNDDNQLMWTSAIDLAKPIFTITYDNNYQLTTEDGPVQVPIFRGGVQKMSGLTIKTYDINEEFHRHNVTRGDRKSVQHNLLLQRR